MPFVYSVLISLQIYRMFFKWQNLVRCFVENILCQMKKPENQTENAKKQCQVCENSGMDEVRKRKYSLYCVGQAAFRYKSVNFVPKLLWLQFGVVRCVNPFHAFREINGTQPVVENVRHSQLREAFSPRNENVCNNVASNVPNVFPYGKMRNFFIKKQSVR